MSTLNSRSRYLYIDLLNIAACYCVVLLHCSGAVFSFAENAVWWYAMIFQAMAHWAVPVFFMITGVTLLGYRTKYDTKTFLKKRLLRTGVPFVVWSLIMFAYRLFVGHSLPWAGFGNLVRRLFSNNIQNIYWFFFSLFGIYLCIPLVSKIVKKENSRLLWFWVALWALNSAIRPLLSRFLNVNIASHFVIPLADGMLGYCVLGWLLHHAPPKKGWRIIIYISGVLGTLLMLFGTYWLNRAENGSLDTLFMTYGSICNIPLAAAVFLLFRDINWSFLECPRWQRVISTFSGASFGVYLFQMIVIYELGRLLKINTFSGKYMLFGSIGIYLFCVLFVSLCRRLPILRHLFP